MADKDKDKAKDKDKQKAHAKPEAQSQRDKDKAKASEKDKEKAKAKAKGGRQRRGRGGGRQGREGQGPSPPARRPPAQVPQEVPRQVPPRGPLPRPAQGPHGTVELGRGARRSHGRRAQVALLRLESLPREAVQEEGRRLTLRPTGRAILTASGPVPLGQPSCRQPPAAAAGRRCRVQADEPGNQDRQVDLPGHPSVARPGRVKQP